MASSPRLSATLVRRARETAHRRRDRDLKVESLEPRLAMATGLLSTLVSVVRDDNSRSLLARGATAEIDEGQELTAVVRLTRRPDSTITVSFRALQDGSRDGDSVVVAYDSATNRGTASFRLTVPQLKNVLDQPITVGYSVGPDGQVRVESVAGITASRFRWNATYREVGADRGLFGTVTVLHPPAGRSATATMAANASVGIVTDGTPFSGGGFDGDGYAYSWQTLGASSTLAWNGVTFDLGSPDTPNMIHAAGQTIAIPQGDYNVLNVAGAAANGPQINQRFRLTFTDTSTLDVLQSFSDWRAPQNYRHESIISTQSYRDTASGGTNQFTNHVYGYSYALPTRKTLQSITLPTNTHNLGILGIAMM